MSNVLNDVQQALFTKLSPLVQLYDHVPAAPSFPYVTFSALEGRDASTKSAAGYSLTVTLQVWSRYAGHSEVQQTLALLRDNLHDAALPISSGTVVRMQEELVAVVRSSEGRLRQGTARYRIVVML